MQPLPAEMMIVKCIWPNILGILDVPVVAQGVHDLDCDVWVDFTRKDAAPVGISHNYLVVPNFTLPVVDSEYHSISNYKKLEFAMHK